MRTFDAEEIAAMLDDMPELEGDRVEPIYEIVIMRTVPTNFQTSEAVWACYVWGAVEVEDIRHPVKALASSEENLALARRMMRALRAQFPRINMRLEVRTFNSTPL